MKRELDLFFGSYYSTFYTIELIDIDGDGILDLVAGSADDTVWASRVFKGSTGGTFDSVLYEFPQHLNAKIFALDWLFIGGKLYMYGADVDPTNGDYSSVNIYEFDHTTNRQRTVFESNGLRFNAWSKDLVWVMPYNGLFVPYDAGLITPRIPITGPAP